MTPAELRALLARATPGAGGGLVTDDEADLFAAWDALPALLNVAEAAIRVTKGNAAKRRHARASQAEIDLAKAVAKLKAGSKEPTR